MMEWLLGIDRLDPADPAVSFGWAHAVPGWGWALIVLGAGSLAWLAYRRLDGPAWSRVVLGVVRAALIVLIAAMIAGPELTKPNERTEPDWVILLADRSSSMTIADGPGGTTREEALRRAIQTASPMLGEINETRRLLALGFDAGVFAIDPLAGEQGLGEADGRRTFLGASLDLALDEVAARPVAGVIVLSDGASSDEVSRRALRRLRAERIPVFALPLGSADPVTDLAIARVEAPASGFVGDRVPVTVTVDRAGRGDTGGAWAELVDTRTDRILDRKRVEIRDDEQGSGPVEVTLLTKPTEAGEAAWAVRLVPDASDLLPDNNEAPITVEVVDRPLRVLHTDGYPRWEFRYLKNLLLREPSIASTSLMLATGRRHIQEGDILLERIPISPGEWEPFDVVVLGDQRAELMTTEQMEQLRDHVADRGAGLLWIAGPGATPGSWRGTPLEALLPMSLGATQADWTEPVVMTRDAEADRFGLLELSDDEAGGWPERLSSPETGWSLLRWAQRIDPARLKPTASVLASFLSASGGSEATPGVITMRYGAGRVVYVATDEIWRWRYARGEALPERFWIPLIRLLGREGLARVGRSAVLEVAPGSVELGTPVSIDLALIDARLVAAAPSSVRVTVANESGQTAAAIDLRPDASTSGSRRFAAVWTAPEPGVYRIVADDPLLGGDRPEVDLSVYAPDDERRQPETDHAALATLTEQTGGAIVSESELSAISGRIPNRERRIAGIPEIETLWDSPLSLILIVLFLSVEWIGRRLIRLA